MTANSQTAMPTATEYADEQHKAAAWGVAGRAPDEQQCAHQLEWQDSRHLWLSSGCESFCGQEARHTLCQDVFSTFQNVGKCPTPRQAGLRQGCVRSVSSCCSSNTQASARLWRLCTPSPDQKGCKNLARYVFLLSQTLALQILCGVWTMLKVSCRHALDDPSHTN